MSRGFRCIIHGSFGKYFAEIQRARQVFVDAGIEVLAPQASELVDSPTGFALFENEIDQDPRLVELLYLHNLKRLGPDGFSYFVTSDGYIGASASYELGVAQLTNTPCFFSNQPVDHPAYFQRNTIWSAEALADYIVTHGSLPTPRVLPNEARINQLWQDLMVPGSVVAAGAIIEHQPSKTTLPKEILLVKTHKWGSRYSVVGGKVRRNELLKDALLREVKEETGLDGQLGAHLCTFDQLKHSGYYQPGVQHIFVDSIVHVDKTSVTLNDEAQDYIWITAPEALKYLDIEPNARATVELYASRQTRHAG